MADPKVTQLKIKIPNWLTSEQRSQLGEDIVEHIRLRTESGHDKNGRKFRRYSPEYVKSLDFKIAGKSKDKINLTLTGDMLAALEVISHRKGQVIVGYEDGEQADKAEGNILGVNGKKPRPFLGISDAKLKQLLSQYEPPEDKEAD